MNEKEVAEIRRRYNREKSNITHIRGCCVNSQHEIISTFDPSFHIMPEEETESILKTLKRTLSGTLGKNLIDITFETKQVVDSDEHRLLTTLRDSSLNDETAVKTFFDHVIESLTIDGSYLILLAHDTYDVPYRSSDGARQADAGVETFSYILCSICPIKLTKPDLSYYVGENEFHNRKIDWLVSAPELGFMFPAFDDRSTNIYNALYYSKNAAESHQSFVDTVFNCAIPMPANEQKELFQSILGETLADDCSYEVVKAVHSELCEIVEEYKLDKEAEPPLISKNTVKEVLESCGVSESHITAFDNKFDTEFGADTTLSPRNIVEVKKFAVQTPNVTITVNPERSDLLKTRTIDGVKYILVRADDDVEVNGVSIHISE